MGSTTTGSNEFIVDGVNLVVGLPPHSAERERVVHELVRRMVAADVFAKWGHKLATVYRLTEHREDVVQVATIAVFEELRSLTLGSFGSGGVQFAAPHLFSVAKAAVKSLSESSATKGLSGVSGAERRKRLLNAHRQTLTDRLGREPSGRELLEFANSEAVRLRGEKAAKQGLRFSADDLAGRDLLSLDDAPGDGGHADVSFEDATDTRIEMDAAVRKVLVRLSDRHPGDEELLLVAKAWMRQMFLGERESKLEVGRLLGLSEAVTSQKFKLLNSVLKEMRS